MNRWGRVVAACLALTLIAAACGGDDDDGGSDGGGETPTTVAAEDIDYEALGLWDDGPCDPEKEPLKIGMMTVFESPVLSLKDQATALEVSAEAFNERGGANGACIEVTTCDDGSNAEQAQDCVRKVDDAGVHATVNDQGTAAGAEVSQAMAEAGIPRVASNVTQDDWGDPNAYPIDASGTGVVFLLPQALINADVDEIGTIRVDLAAASALLGLLEQVYEGDATFPYDTPVPGGTTDFSQFILGAQDAGVGGVTLALGESEAVHVVKAGEQLGTDLKIGSSLGSFPHSTVADLGDFAENMVFLWSFPPATFDLPVYDALRTDLGSTGEEQLQPENLKTSPMRSWIGLYALLKVLRDAEMTTFTREDIKKALDEAKDVPMLDIFGGEDWTPSLNHPGLYKRAGTNHWATYKWDPDAEGDYDGNFVETSTISFDETLCDSPFGGPCQ